MVLGVVIALGGPAAQAADGDPVLLGRFNNATVRTEVTSNTGTALYGETLEARRGYAGVVGFNLGGGDGVFGGTTSAQSSGVYGRNTRGGVGVTGDAKAGAGVAVLALARQARGVALRTTGKLQFQHRSGVIKVAPRHKSEDVRLAGVTRKSMVTATVQQRGGYFVVAAVPGPGSFKIVLNKVLPAHVRVRVAYLVLN
jgi:hypothetical protein